MERGFEFVEGAAMRARLGGTPSDWDAFVASWNDLQLDTYMADGGRYRRRRHARYAATSAGITRKPHGPHYQALAYNPLHGGIDRWFEPITDAVGASQTMTTILRWCQNEFGIAHDWDVEVHQFRIEAQGDRPGKPTPEGVHRDGVDYVLVLLVQRTNIQRGTTTIHAPDGTLVGSFTLTEPFDAALVDDARMSHGVTPVEPIDPTKPAYRDVLVVTFHATAPRRRAAAPRRTSA